MTKQIPFPQCHSETDSASTTAKAAATPALIPAGQPTAGQHAADEGEAGKTGDAIPPESGDDKAGIAVSVATAQDMQLKSEINAAAAKGFQEDIATFAKAEKDAADAIAKYPAALEKLEATQKPLECFRTHDWPRILKNPHSQTGKVDAIIKAACDAISEQAKKVADLNAELAKLQQAADAAAARRAEALAKFQSAIGYAAETEAILKAGGELAAKASKVMTTQPATSYMLGSGAIAYADSRKSLKAEATFRDDVTAALSALSTAAEAARQANLELVSKAITTRLEQKKLDALVANRDAAIAAQVAALDSKPSEVPDQAAAAAAA